LVLDFLSFSFLCLDWVVDQVCVVVINWVVRAVRIMGCYCGLFGTDDELFFFFFFFFFFFLCVGFLVLGFASRGTTKLF
jgi:hypothetical protein